jgi:4-amino-4-deoxy-L-arabinose transferase-like glycosyltransferase
VGRTLGALLGTIGVALTGVLAHQLVGRKAALIAMALAAIYLPAIEYATALMSEQLFVVLMLAALTVAIEARRRKRLSLAVASGFLAGLAVLTRANGLILLAPLVLALWRQPRAAVALVAVALLTVTPWTIRNERDLHAFIPVTTQLGTALAGTYNVEAKDDPVNPGSWRSLRHVESMRRIQGPWLTTPEPVIEQRLRAAAEDFIREHPAYLFTVLYWNTRRILDLASLKWSRHTASTISVTPGWANIGVVTFWLFALLAIAGATRARAIPLYVWLVPLVMYVSVIFLAAETPRYRAPLDPFLILLAALAIGSAGERGARDRGWVRRGDRGLAGAASGDPV